MASLRGSLPRPALHPSDEPRADEQTTRVAVGSSSAPRYGARTGFLPRSAANFADGGAFPEIHVAQYPPGQGLVSASGTAEAKTAVATVTITAGGDASYDSIVTEGRDKDKIVHSKHAEMIPKPNNVFERPSEADTQLALAKTKEALLGRVEKKAIISQSKNAAGGVSAAPEYIKYTPSKQGIEYNSGASHRLIKMHQVQEDPLDPPKFRHKKVPRGPGSPPVPVMHSPPRSISGKEQLDWKIPPSISNWKNPKGYTIPLDKRLAADGRGLQEVQINDNFAKLSEALYLAEQKAREAVETRARIQHELLNNQKERKEEELRNLAQQARRERVGGNQLVTATTNEPAFDSGAPGGEDSSPVLERNTRNGADEDEGRTARDEIREERRREREKERRLEAGEARVGKKSKITRDRDRDVSEQIALGQSNLASSGAADHAYDQRLFDQEQGISSGFHGDDAYDLYDKPLFTEKGQGIYKPSASAGDGGTVASKDSSRGGPVEFARQGGGGGNAGGEQADPFGIDNFLSEVKGSK